MKLIKVAAGVVNQTPLAWDQNLENIRRTIERAREEQVTILCLPELCLTGYGCEDMFHSPGVQRTALELLHQLLPETEGMIVSLGLPLLVQNAIFNTAALVADGKILGFTAKRFLAGDGIHYEHRWFKPWPIHQQATVEINDRHYLVGDLYYDCGGVKIGFEICEDAWVANRPGSELSRKGVDIVLNPSASHFAFGKAEIRRRFVIDGSRAFSATYVYTNLLGNEAGRAIYEGGAFVASGGKLLVQGPRFSYRDYSLTTAVVDVDITRMKQSQLGGYYPEFQRKDLECVDTEFEYPPVLPTESETRLPDWEYGTHLKEEEFTRAMGLALFDYLRKSYSKGFVVSLSGGADSTAVATLVALMVELAVSDLGIDEFKRKLHNPACIAKATTIRELVQGLLLTVYQSTRNSGDTTRNAAKVTAEAVGASHLVLDVDALVQGYTNIVEEGFGEPLTWEKHDIALQNIQARVRAPSVWFLTNLRGALLLATSNRSEAAVGYATMDGDTAGGLSPIAGIDKDFLRRWLRWMEQHGPHGFRAIPELAVVNKLAPTAELRPSEDHQTDEADLMPYDLLDAIERAAIRDKQMPVEVFQKMHLRFPQYSRAQLGIWVERFYRLWCRNQWKRERYAPSFHVDDENLDPKTWCRFPILSGGFEKELRELRELLAEG